MKKHFKILTFLYIIVLIWAIIFKMNNFEVLEKTFNYSIEHGVFFDIKSIFPPFPIPSYYFSLGTEAGRINLLNLLAFIPFGFFAAKGTEKSALKTAVLHSFFFSLALEVFQIFYFTTSFELIDLLFNTIGGLLGALIFLAFKKIGNLFPSSTRENTEKAFVVICYLVFSSVALYGIINTALHIDFYIEKQVEWMQAVIEFCQN